MPYFRIHASKTLTEEQIRALNEGLGDAAEAVPGKDRSMVILELHDGVKYYCAGAPPENFVNVDILIFGQFDYAVKRRLTEDVFKVLTDAIGTPKETATLSITETTAWGCFGTFVDVNEKQ